MFTVALIRRGRSRESCLLTQSKKLSVCRALQNPSGDLWQLAKISQAQLTRLIFQRKSWSIKQFKISTFFSQFYGISFKLEYFHLLPLAEKILCEREICAEKSDCSCHHAAYSSIQCLSFQKTEYPHLYPTSPLLTYLREVQLHFSLHDDQELFAFDTLSSPCMMKTFSLRKNLTPLEVR